MVRGLKTNLLGLPAITALDLLEKLCAVTDQDIREQYPKVFTGLGTFGEKYEIKVKENATPFALYETYLYPYGIKFRKS